MATAIILPIRFCWRNTMTKIKIDTGYIYLSSMVRAIKTDNFVRKTKNVLSTDNIVDYITQGIIKDYKISQITTDELTKFDVTVDGLNGIVFSFCLGKDVKTNMVTLDKWDIVFFDIEGVQKRDERIFDFLSHSKILSIDIAVKKTIFSQNDFSKLYVLSSDDGVNFPLLNKKQKEIIDIEDNNVLVQGVAGSGKTNICITKLVNASLREYGGRVLYSTYSKALLGDIKNKLGLFKQNIKFLSDNIKRGRVIFTDDNHIKAVENKLGIWMDITDAKKITEKLDKTEQFLTQNIDLFLIEDIAQSLGVKSKEEKIADEKYFINTYIPDIKNYQLASKLEKVKYLSYEIIYKEIYGMIYGYADITSGKSIITLKEYKQQRQGSFLSNECDIIYSIAQDYYSYLIRKKMVDNNILSQRIIESDKHKYSLSVIDEVQDFSRNNLLAIKSCSRRMFCVGDAMQMINPSYFSFSMLKNIMFDKDISDVRQLTNNYRNSAKIEKIAEKLNIINKKQFGVHNFVLNGESLSDDGAGAYYSNGNIDIFKENKLENMTIVCASSMEKEKLKKSISDVEVLTVSEIKGLERNSVILYNILSSNYEKWNDITTKFINRKTSDENSVYRYYFNLFYVGITRAKQNLYVLEEKNIPLFKDFFETDFETKSSPDFVKIVCSENQINKITDDELLEKIDEFINAYQFENARFTAGKLTLAYDRERQNKRIDAYEKFSEDSSYRSLGMALWQSGFILEAKTQFNHSGDKDVIELIDACQSKNSDGISGDIIEFLPLVSDNQVASSLIVQTMRTEVEKLKQSIKQSQETFKKLKENKNGNK